MERRLAKVNISAAGGTAASGAKTCKITLPSAWLAALGVTENRRQMELAFDGETIVISPALSMEEFAARKKRAGHDLRAVRYYDGDRLCTLIYADFTDHTLRAENYAADPVKTAFGRQRQTTWADFQAFLEERCVPRARAGLREYLEAIGVSEYDPLAIVEKTGGRMAEDRQWLAMEAM